MTLRPFILAIILLTVPLTGPGPAAASGKKAPEAGVSDGGFNLVPVAAPVIIDGRVVNYVFVTLRLVPSAPDKASQLKQKEAFFRDALVRAAHRTPFIVPGDYNTVDEARICAAMLAVSPSIAGRGLVRQITVAKQQAKNLRRNPKRPTPPAP